MAPLAALCAVLVAGACGEGNSATIAASAPVQAGAEAGGATALSPDAQKFLAIQPVGASAEKFIARIIPGHLALRPQALTSIGVPAAGRVTSVRVRPGERVAAGQALAVIQSADAAGAHANVEQANARAAAAEDALRRQNEMMAKGVGLEVERFAAETAAREARAEQERARRAVALIGATPSEGDVVTVRAPTGGVVMEVKTSAGAMVTPGGDPLLVLADSSRLWLVADVPETDAAGIAKGQAMNVYVPSQSKTLEGVVDGLGSQVDSDTRRLPIYVALRGNLAGLTPGMQAELRVASGMKDTLMLPVEAVLIKDGKRSVVYVQQTDGKFAPREVRTGVSKGGYVPILSGLQPGERVVVKGALLLDSEAEQLL